MSEEELEKVENGGELTVLSLESDSDTDVPDMDAIQKSKEENNNVPFCKDSQSAHAEVPQDYVHVLCGDLKRIERNYNVRLKFSICVEGKSLSSVEQAIQYVKEQIGNRPLWTYDNVTLEGNGCDNGEKKKSKNSRKGRWDQSVPLLKNFYTQSPEVGSMSAELVAEMRLENDNTSASRMFETSIESLDDIPNPVWKLEHCFEGYSDLLAHIREQGLASPTPIQAQAWPILLKGEDLVCLSQTGKGKTLAFVLPALIHTECQTLSRDARGGPNVLVLSPTIELALEIEEEVNKYTFRGLKVVGLYAGGNRREQINSLKKCVQIIVCTPGRLMDLMRAKIIDLTSITYVVLAEADYMLDMGLEPQIIKVLLSIRPDRQTVITCATLPPAVLRLAQTHMNNPVKLCVGPLILVATENVTHIVEVMDESDKLCTIKTFVGEISPADKIVIYIRKQAEARKIFNNCMHNWHRCRYIHEETDQAERDQGIADLTAGILNILIVTEAAAGGLPLKNITHIINFDFPRNMPEYIHRVSLASPTGTCLSYVTPADAVLTPKLISLLEKAHQVVTDDLRSIAAGTWRKLCMKERARARKSRWSKCAPLFKNFYNEHTEVANMPPERVAQLRLENNTVVFKEIEDSARKIPNPVWKFEHCFDMYPDLLEQIYKHNLEQPTALQAQVWPILLRGEDLICISSNSADKTLSFVLPALIHTAYQSIPSPNVLILTPTRDLAPSIEKVVNKFAFRGIKTGRHVCHLKDGTQILIFTPGQMVTKLADLASITYVVLAEADRLLAKDTKSQIRKILNEIRPDRQTIITSSTWPMALRRLARLYTNNPVQVYFDETPVLIEETLVKE